MLIIFAGVLACAAACFAADLWLLLCRRTLRPVLEADYTRYVPDRPRTGELFKAYWDTLTGNHMLSYIITMRLCAELECGSFLDKLRLQFYRVRLRRLQVRFGVEISYKTHIGAGLKISHGNGVVIHEGAQIGRNCTILQQVTIGNNPQKNRFQVPVIGDNCYIGAGAKVIGPIFVGDDVIIGAQSVVNKDVPAGSVVAGVPAKIIRSVHV